jgi:energy-coupling factor transporter ATP-binding protein EcfA2
MPRYFLTKVCIEGFRGINNEADPLDLRFRPDAVNSVYAVNGVGKSSLFEALCYAIRGTIPKLDELQAGERPEEYYNNRFHSLQTATIDLEFLADDGSNEAISIRVRRDRVGNRTVTSPSGQPDPEAFLRDLREDFALLDYRTFVRFIDDTPLTRGRSFSALLGLSAYSHMRQALQAASDTRSLNSDLDIRGFEATLDGAQDTSQRALASVRESFESVTGRPLEDVSKLAQYQAEVHQALGVLELLKPHFQGRALGEVEFDAVKEAVRTAEGGEKRRELESAVETITRLDALGDGDTETAEIEQSALSELLTQRDALLSATRGDLFRRLYHSAKVVIDGGAWGNDRQCPLCESRLETSIKDHIGAQLDQYQQVAAKSEEIKNSWRSSAWVRRLHLLEKSEPMGVPEEDRLSVPLTHRADSGELTKEELTAASGLLTRLERQRQERRLTLRASRAELEKELPPSLVRLTEQVEHGRQFQESLELHLRKEVEKEGLRARLGIRRRWQTFINQATTDFADAETALSRSRITAIDDEYKSMFQHIMNISDVVPELERAERGEGLSVQLSEFHGQHDLSARALLSESYRNALAISVFLSAALNHSGSPRFVVLDDVTSSFDSGHQFHLMELVRQGLQYPQNAGGLQFLILSHDGLLEKYFDRLGNTNDWHHQKLQGWPPMGNVMSQAQDANRLRVNADALLDAGQVAEAEPLMRQYLEFRLQQVIRRVNIPVPIDFAIKDHTRMVANCLDAINAAIGLHKQVGDLVLDPQQVQDLDTAHVPALVGNWVSHYETATGSSLSPPALKGVLDTIDNFAECFRFEDTSSPTPRRRWYRSLSQRN